MATDTAPALASDSALSDVERLLSKLGADAGTLDALLCAVELYGDLRADETHGA